MSQVDSPMRNDSQKVPSGGLPLSRRTAIQLSAAAIAAATSCLAKAERPQSTLGKSTLGEILRRRHTGDSAYKATAIADYHANVAAFGGRLSAPVERLLASMPRQTPWQFDVRQF